VVFLRLFPRQSSSVRLTIASNVGLGGFRLANWPLNGGRDRAAKGLDLVSSQAVNDESDVLLFCGNLFQSPSPEPCDIALAARGLKRLNESSVLVGAITGDKDTPGPGNCSILDVFEDLGLMKNLNNCEKPFVIETDSCKLALSSLPWDLDSDTRNPLTKLQYNIDADFHMLLTHYPVEGVHTAPSNVPVLNLDSVSALLGVDVLATGYSNQSSHATAGSTTVLTPGSPSSIDGRGGFISIDVSGETLSEVGLISGLSPAEYEVEIPASLLSLDNASSLIINKINQKIAPDASLSVSITGRIPSNVFRAAALGRITDYARKRCESFEWDLSGLRIVESDNERAAGPVSIGSMIEQEAYLIRDAESGVDEEALARAMAMVRLALENGSLEKGN